MYDYSRKKQRRYKRETKRILQYLQSVEPTYHPQYDNDIYESIKCYANLFFVPKGKVKKELLHILLQKTEQIIANKPKDLPFCKVFLSVPKHNITHSQISLLFDENYYRTFWDRNNINIQRWTKLEKPSITEELEIPTTLPHCGYLEEIPNEFGFYIDELWFYGEIACTLGK